MSELPDLARVALTCRRDSAGPALLAPQALVTQIKPDYFFSQVVALIQEAGMQVTGGLDGLQLDSNLPGVRSSLWPVPSV